MAAACAHVHLLGLHCRISAAKLAGKRSITNRISIRVQPSSVTICRIRVIASISLSEKAKLLSLIHIYSRCTSEMMTVHEGWFLVCSIGMSTEQARSDKAVTNSDRDQAKDSVKSRGTW